MRSRATRWTRAGAVTAAIFGFFGLGWFGWGQADAGRTLAIALGVGWGVALLLTVAGVVLAVRAPASTRALQRREDRRRYGIVVGVECLSAAAGAGILAAFGAQQYIPVWIAAVVGAHFFPLAAPLHSRLLPVLGGLMCAVALLGLVLGLRTAAPVAAVTGLGCGTLLVVFGVLSLLARQDRSFVER